MEVTAGMVKDLRQATDAPMMDCKKALSESNGDMEKAKEWLRDRGMAQSAKKADRIAAEGLLGLKVSDTFTSASLVEINSETDFVAKNDGFINLVNNTAAQVFVTKSSSVEELNESSYETDTFSEYFSAQVARIGEKIVVRRFITLNAAENGCVNGYVHSNGRIGVLVAAKCSDAKVAAALAPMLKNVAMHAAAMKPTTLTSKDFDPAFVEAETIGRIEAIKTENEELGRLKKPLKNVPLYISMSQLTPDVLKTAEDAIKTELASEGKPEKIWGNIIPGKMARFIADNTTLDKELALLDQNYVMDDSMSVAEAIAKEAEKHGGTAELVEFIKYEVGEGLEKKVDNFAAEVAAQIS
ncbi:translation elongation factor Ts [Sulfurimonas sp.]|uniref:translation elongation factor Ts n=1 Tax=Sulfurimonas sp. TaxID=2022749 RepID=UPI0025CFB3A2|nr:translation elongation factor Ts [Sulfurimonas sp.]